MFSLACPRGSCRASHHLCINFALFLLLFVACLAFAVCTSNVSHVSAVLSISASCLTLQAQALLVMTIAQKSLLSGTIGVH